MSNKTGEITTLILGYENGSDLARVLADLGRAGASGFRVYVDRVESVRRWDKERLQGCHGE